MAEITPAPIEAPPARPAGRDEVRAALIYAATDLFAARGFAAVSTREIAREAHVSHTLVFRHFGAKDGLIAAVVDHALGIGPAGLRRGPVVPPLNGEWHLAAARASATRTSLFMRLGLELEHGDRVPAVFPLLDLYLEGVEAIPTEGRPDDVLSDPRVVAFLTLALSSNYIMNEDGIRARLPIGLPADELDKAVILVLDMLYALRRGARLPPFVRATRSARSAPHGVANDVDPVAAWDGSRPDRRPHGRDEVRAAVLQTAATLFARRDVNAVGIREIAAASGVQPALVFRHFGTKAGLLGAVLDDRVARATAAAVTMRSSREDLLPLVHHHWAPDGYGVLALRARLAGYRPEQLQGGFPVAATMFGLLAADVEPDVEAGRRPALPPMVALAIATWMLAGSAALAPVLRRAYHLDDVDLPAAVADASQLVLELARSADAYEAASS